MTLDHHTGGEYISVEIDHPLAIPPEGTLALQLFIEKIDVVLVVIGNLGIRDGDNLRALKAKPLIFSMIRFSRPMSGVPYPAFETQELRGSPLLLTLGKDDTFPVTIRS